VGRGIIIGKVVDPDGRAVAGAYVMIVRGPQHEDVALLTDAEGEFCLGAPETGIYRLLVNAPGFAPVERNVEITDQAAPIRITIGEI
jgi:energy-converting hydrogenase Eha subunit B